jgi:hypothetical protein
LDGTELGVRSFSSNVLAWRVFKTVATTKMSTANVIPYIANVDVPLRRGRPFGSISEICRAATAVVSETIGIVSGSWRGDCTTKFGVDAGISALQT